MKLDWINEKIYFAQLIFITELFVVLTAAANITDLMDDDLYLDAILHNFGLLAVAVTKFTDNYSTDRDLMLSNKTQIKDMINQNRKMYWNHSGTNQSCYINTTKIICILAFHRGQISP